MRFGRKRLYDGFASAAGLAALAFASEQIDHAPARWAWFECTELVSVGVGAIHGLIGATVISRRSARGWISDTWAQSQPRRAGRGSLGRPVQRLHASGLAATAFAGAGDAIVSPRSRATGHDAGFQPGL